MFYNYEIITPANTPEANKQSKEIKLVPGIIHYVRVAFPIGSAGLLHVVIRRPGVQQLWPSNPEGSFIGDDSEYAFKEFYYIPFPAELVIDTWNDDDTYSHSCIVGLAVLPEEAIVPELLLKDVLESIAEYFGV